MFYLKLRTQRRLPAHQGNYSLFLETSWRVCRWITPLKMARIVGDLKKYVLIPSQHARIVDSIRLTDVVKHGEERKRGSV